ncbi:hypothetical protein BS17DRAFT_690065 [Gyrodon lividus]|nr:hypothetical protein BS17DRAFT_690065 [Gyrodon lividus]
MSGIYAIPKLMDMNWVDFKRKTVVSLTTCSLSCHLSGTVKAPKALPVSKDGMKMYLPDSMTKASETDIKNNLVLLKSHVQKEALAIQQIYATIPSTVMILIQDKDTVAEA